MEIQIAQAKNNWADLLQWGHPLLRMEIRRGA